jgi:hypothetical protein
MRNSCSKDITYTLLPPDSSAEQDADPDSYIMKSSKDNIFMWEKFEKTTYLYEE